MEELAVRFAEFLEQIATRVRSLTVDRADRTIYVVGLGIVMALVGLVAIGFLVSAIFGALRILLTPAGAYGVLAGLFLIAGALFWLRRK
ncbi:MAG: hypothetical protein GEU79_03155 [Acidimicrobiia bacterium]|nr:hypothetical protein [Acidimicrobiia bacterium]